MKKNVRAIAVLFLGSLLSAMPNRTDCRPTAHLKLKCCQAQKVIPLEPQEQTGQVHPLPIEEPMFKKIIAKGVASIYEGNIENARKAALRAAYAEAVSRGCGTELGSISIIRNMKYISDVIMERSRGFIRSYQVLSEGPDREFKKYEIAIEAEIVEAGKAQGKEIEGLRLFLELLGNPQLLIIFPEIKMAGGPSDISETKVTKIEYEDKEARLRVTKKANVPMSSGKESQDIQLQQQKGTTLRSAEAALAKAFSEYGYRVQTSDDLATGGLYSQDDLAGAKAGDTQRIRRVARLAEADLVLYGTLASQTEFTKPAGVDMVKVVAEASAKAMIVSSDRTIEAFHRSDQAANFSELKAYADCMDKVAHNIADVLAWKIPQILAYDFRETRLVLSGVKTYDQVQKLMDSLKGVNGIEAVQPIKVPTVRENWVELKIMTGFIPAEPDEIIAMCSKTLEATLQVEDINKFEIRCKLTK